MLRGVRALMNSVILASVSIRRILRYMEWSLIVAFILVTLVNGLWSVSADLSKQLVALLTAFAVLS